MKTIKTVPFEPIEVGFMPDTLEQGKLYISHQFGVAIHLCFCGCGIKTVTPLRGPDAWTLTDENGKVSLDPSLSNHQLPCKSHYVITKNKANFI